MDKKFTVLASVNEVSNKELLKNYLPVLVWGLVVFISLFGLSNIFPSIVNIIFTAILILDFIMLVPVIFIMRKNSRRLSKLQRDYKNSMIDIIISDGNAYIEDASQENKLTAITWEDKQNKLYFVRQNKKSLLRVRILPPDSLMIKEELNSMGIKTPTIEEVVSENKF